MRRLTEAELLRWLRGLEDRFEVLLPVLLVDGSRALGRLDEGAPALAGGRLPRKPTEAFFPQHDPVLTAALDGAILAMPAARPLFVLGFTAADLACLEFIDRFFAAPFRDDLYYRRRAGAVVAGLTGALGPAGEILPPAGGNCDLEVIATGDAFLLDPYTPAGQSLTGEVGVPAAAPELRPVQSAAAALSDEPQRLLQRASELIRADRVPDAFWAEIGTRCIACTACNLVCPTCTCYGVQDWSYPDRTERSRMWDSCQLEGFMREASGHNPLGSEALRTRRRIHHKLAADVERWGHLTCYLCGRCDAACPTGIGIQAIARELVARYG